MVSLIKNKGIRSYNNIDDALKEITSNYDEKENRKLTEIEEIPECLSFKDFNQYVNQFDNKKIK